MKKKRGLLITSGGAWNAYGGGTLARLNVDYSVIYGFGTGALLAPMVALEEWYVIKEIFTSLTDSNIFDNNFGGIIGNFGEIKKMPLIYTILSGKKTIGSTNNIKKTINGFFNIEYFNDLKTYNKEIILAVQNVSEIPPKTHYFSSMNETYEDFKDWMWCASNIPIFGSLVKKSWNDTSGGYHLGEWSGSALITLNVIEQIKQKKIDELDIIMHRPRYNEKYEGNRINNMIDYVSSVIDGMYYNIEYEYLYYLIKELNAFNIGVRVFWLPRKLSTNNISYIPHKMLEWWEEGYSTAFDIDRVDVFNPNKRY